MIQYKERKVCCPTKNCDKTMDKWKCVLLDTGKGHCLRIQTGQASRGIPQLMDKAINKTRSLLHQQGVYAVHQAMTRDYLANPLIDIRAYLRSPSTPPFTHLSLIHSLSLSLSLYLFLPNQSVGSIVKGTSTRK